MKPRCSTIDFLNFNLFRGVLNFLSFFYFLFLNQPPMKRKKDNNFESFILLAIFFGLN